MKAPITASSSGTKICLTVLMLVLTIGYSAPAEATGQLARNLGARDPLTLTTKLSKPDHDSRVRQKLKNGVVPNILGLNSLEANEILAKSGFSPMWSPSDFDESFLQKSQFQVNGANWFVCRQANSPGTVIADPGYLDVGVSRDCSGYGVLINVVGMKAAVGWQLLVNRGFAPQ